METPNIASLILTSSGITEADAPATSVMYSTATTLNMAVKGTMVYCTLQYLELSGFTYLNSTLPTYSQNAKFYIQAATNVSIDTSQFRGCGISQYGGVFWLAQGTPFYDANSVYEFNAGAYGGVINCQSCRVELWYTTFDLNMAWRGGVIELRETSFLKGYQVTFTRNQAFYSAGAIYLSSLSYMQLSSSTFTLNTAP